MSEANARCCHAVLKAGVTTASACGCGLFGSLCCGSSSAHNLEARNCLLATIGKSAGSQDKLGDATATRSNSGDKSTATAVGGGNNGADGSTGERDGATNTIGSSDVLIVIIVVVVVVVASTGG